MFEKLEISYQKSFMASKMSFFEAFRFKRVDTWLHKLDPRAKLLLLGCFFLSPLYTDLLILVVFFSALLLIALSARIFRELLRAQKGASFFSVIIFAANLWTGYSPGHALAMTFRFLILFSAVSIFFLTTRPDDFAMALEKLKVPYRYCFMLTMAIRCVPMMATEALTIMDAQRSRGLEIERGGLVKRARNLIPILIPLLTSSIRRSLEMAEAIESRAWEAVKNRTSLYTLKLKEKDYFVIAMSTSVFLICVYNFLFR